MVILWGHIYVKTNARAISDSEQNMMYREQKSPTGARKFTPRARKLESSGARKNTACVNQQIALLVQPVCARTDSSPHARELVLIFLRARAYLF